jgi:hypothetical protein
MSHGTFKHGRKAALDYTGEDYHQQIIINQRSFGVPHFQTNMTGHLMVHGGLDMNLVPHLLVGKAGVCSI